jgi:GNAT superfamily N-acetyltransferase
MLEPTALRPVDSEVLDNIIWHSLVGAHARFSVGANEARRYSPGFTPIAGFADAQHPDFAALAPFCAPDEHLYIGGWSGQAPGGWHVHLETSMQQMVWGAPIPDVDPAFAAVPLAAQHVPQMLELVALRPPGPFGPRTRELGDYYGVIEHGRLVAMAGERLAASAWREISGVCTHPDVEGRGLAWRLIAKVVRSQMQRGEKPFLHVMSDNLHARRLYERMGFRFHQEIAVRVVSRL